MWGVMGVKKKTLHIMIARQRGQMSPGGVSRAVRTKKPRQSQAGEPTRARGVSQAGETDSRTTMISNRPEQKKNEENKKNSGLADSQISAGRIERAL